MRSKMENLIALIVDMQKKGWNIHAFFYEYNKVRTVVLVKSTNCFVSDNKFDNTICKLTFFDRDNDAHSLETEANERSFSVSVTDIRRFFNIKSVKNVNDFLDSFYEHFNRRVPLKVDKLVDEELQICINNTYISKAENPYTNCFAVKRNGNNGQRSPFNEDKAKRYCPDIYEHFKSDTNISFCFHEGKPSSLKEILERLANSK